jgi:hypothetical protein
MCRSASPVYGGGETYTSVLVAGLHVLVLVLAEVTAWPIFHHRIEGAQTRAAGNRCAIGVQ